jgi:hypothetical protein
MTKPYPQVVYNLEPEKEPRALAKAERLNASAL